MSKLLRLRKWLPLADAARTLSGLMEEDISEADLLRLALDRQLTLSVHFVNGAWVRQWVVLGMASPKSTDVRWPETEDSFELPEDGMPEAGAIRSREGEPLMQLMGPIMFSEPNVWDLPMVSAEVVDVEREYQRLCGGPERTTARLTGVTVQDSTGLRCELYVPKDESEDSEALGHTPTFGHPEDFYPANALPVDSTLVVRTEALMALQAKLVQPEPAKKPADGGNEHAARAASGATAGPRWPNHDTKKLMALRMAAVRFWSNYDPAQPDTAPKNEAVIEWLQREHGILATPAAEMASILRPESLRTGPR